jgi:hypothetical protein
VTIVRTPRGPVGHWSNPRHASTERSERRKHQLDQFGRLVLAILDDSPNWNADTIALIAAGAEHFGLVSEEATPVIASKLKETKK